jgi:hypothetical protein
MTELMLPVKRSGRRSKYAMEPHPRDPLERVHTVVGASPTRYRAQIGLGRANP